MPTYAYWCPACGEERSVVKPMTHASDPEWCAACARPLRRRYSGQAFIMRPTGYDLRPGERGYSDFSRATALGEVREPDAASRLSAGATISSRLTREPHRFEDDKMKRFHDAARAVYNAATGRHEW